MKMVRKQVYITQEQDDLLEDLSKYLGVPESELIRRGIDLIERETEEQGVLQEASAERLIALLEERAAQFPEGGGTVKWKREDAYDDERHTRLLR